MSKPSCAFAFELLEVMFDSLLEGPLLLQQRLRLFQITRVEA